MRSQICSALFLFMGLTSALGQYYGKDLGKLTELHHGVKGRVYAVDSRTLFIKDFHYDGEGPAAFFYVGNTKSPSTDGAFRVRDERGSTGVLRKYRGKDVTLTLPEGKTLASIRWFSVYCDEYAVNFGDVKIPRNFDYPRPQKIAALSGVHGVSSDPIVIVDAQTLLVPNFSYDGEAPDAKFWVGQGDKPSPQGIKIPDENGKIEPLRRYERKTIVLTLPGELTVFDLGHFGVWCEAFTVDFGHVRLPQLTNVPPSLKMLGVSPQNRNQALIATASHPKPIQPQPNRGQNKYQTDLKPTTYRPHLSRIGASLTDFGSNNFETPFNVNDARFHLAQSSLPSQLHRRADEFNPPRAQQLEPEPFTHNTQENQRETHKTGQNGQELLRQAQQFRQNAQDQPRQTQQYSQSAPEQKQQAQSSLEIVPSQELYYHSQPLQSYQQYQQQVLQPQTYQSVQFGPHPPEIQSQQHYYEQPQQYQQQYQQQYHPQQRAELRQYYPNGNGQIQYVLSQTHGLSRPVREGPIQKSVDLDPERRSGYIVQRA